MIEIIDKRKERRETELEKIKEAGNRRKAEVAFDYLAQAPAPVFRFINFRLLQLVVQPTIFCL